MNSFTWASTEFLPIKMKVWVERPNQVNFVKENKNMTPIPGINMGSSNTIVVLSKLTKKQ